MGQRISVIIPTKGRPEHLPFLLRSLSGQSRQVDEVIVIDDSNHDDFLLNDEMLSSFAAANPRVTVSHSRGRGVGLTDARNQGLDISTGDVISFLDDDVVLEPEYYENLMRAMEKDDVAGATGAVTNFPESLFWSLFCRAFFLSNHSRVRGYMMSSGYPCFIFNSEVQRKVEVMSGCNMNFRRDVLSKDRFDDRLRGYSYMEDSDLSYRISRENRLLFEPGCRLVHNNKDRAVNESYFRMKMSHHRYFFRKNMSQSPLNLIAYAVSVLGDLLLATQRAIVQKNPKLVRAALEGLSIEVGEESDRC